MENESKQLNEQAQELMQEERWIDAIKLVESQPSLLSCMPNFRGILDGQIAFSRMSEGKVKRRPRTRRPGYVAVIDLIAALPYKRLQLMAR